MTALKLLAITKGTGISLSAKGDRLAFDAPAAAMTPELRALLLACKPELLAVLKGDYLSAARLMIAARVAEQLNSMVYSFDERAGICEYEGNMNRDEAERQAYIELAITLEGGDDDLLEDAFGLPEMAQRWDAACAGS